MTTPSGPTVRQSVALVWRNLRSMRTALILLLILAAASVIGSLLPQIPNSPERVGRYLDDHGAWGTFLFRAGFFDVYGSWWFVLITTLLFVSLAACLFPRTRALLRALRQRPIHARELDGFLHHAELRVGATPDEAAAGAARYLRRKRFRVSRQGGAVAAEKGVLREVGSLLFHCAFFLLLVGVIVGKGTGFTGRAVVTEGETWVDARANYAGEIRTGRYFGGAHTGMGIELLDFDDSYRRNGLPIDFVSRVRFLDREGRPAGVEEIRVNHPASRDGLRIFQEGFGWAPVVTAVARRHADVVHADRHDAGRGAGGRPGDRDAVARSDQADRPRTRRDDHARALVGLPGVREPPAHRRAHADAGAVRPVHPLLRLRGPDRRPGARPRSTRPGCERVARGDLHAAGTAHTDVAGVGDLTLSFPELRQYSVLLISRDIGIPAVLAAAILVLVGLIPALYVSRRKVWVRAEAAPGGALVKIGGFALQRKESFDEEFDRIVRAVGGLEGAAPHAEEPVGTS